MTYKHKKSHEDYFKSWINKKGKINLNLYKKINFGKIEH